MCVFGGYQDTDLYPRNRALIEAVSRNFDSVVEVRPATPAKSSVRHRDVARLKTLFRLIWRYLATFFSLARQAGAVRGADTVFIPYPAYVDFFFLKVILLGRKQPKLIIDAFLCLHDTLVNDRKLLRPDTMMARLVAWLEAHTLSAADLIFIDTNQQRELLVHSYHLPPGRLIVTPVGIDEALWSPLDFLPMDNKFRVIFWGTFIPLHGLQYVVSAAAIIAGRNPKIEFRIIGDGQTADQVARQIADSDVPNITWERSLISGAELRSEVARSHCVLGVFGASEKAGNVVPYKVYQAMACNKLVISREGPAIYELARTSDNSSGLFLVPPADPEALASTIEEIYCGYSCLCSQVATRKLYDSFLSNSVLQSRIDAALQLGNT